MFNPADPLKDLFESVILEPLAFAASVPDLLAKGRAKIASQTKTANMIGKFVVPMAKRKIDAEIKNVAESVRSYLTSTETKKGSTGSSQARSSSFDSAAEKTSGPTPSVTKPSSPEHLGSEHRGSEHSSLDVNESQLPGSREMSSPKRAKPQTSKSPPPAVKTSTPKTAQQTATKQAAAKQAATKPNTSLVKAKRSKPSAPAPKMSGSPVSPTENDLGLDHYDDLPASSVVALLEALTPAQLRAISVYESSHRNRQTILGGVTRLLNAAQ
jgi:hypothetical protein